jgi:sterol desaturase/sphingolipid hydroxylase (fatty acid hydroxylase superfamily)
MWWIPLCTFWLLLLFSLGRKKYRAGLRHKATEDWLLDLSGLFVQGWVIPLLELALVYGAMKLIFPSLEGTLTLGIEATFFLQLVVVDYLYYWNHRLLHSKWMWPIHRVHHSVTQLDIWGTSRNTLWSSFFIVYLWVNGILLFLVAEQQAYATAVAITAALDLWRHSSWGFDQFPRLQKRLSWVLVLPQAHARHHSDNLSHRNYGANFSIWDRVHKTWSPENEAVKKIGISHNLSIYRCLLWPFSHRPKNQRPA